MSQSESATHVLLVAQDHRAALRVVAKYAREPFEEVPLLRRSVSDTKSDSVTLKNGVALIAYPCRPQAVRGLRCSCVVADELAHFRTNDGVAQDREMLTALRPTLATTGGRLLILSSPYHQVGALWDLFRTHHGRDDSPVLIWQASAPDMNPTLRASYLASMAESDPTVYRSEVLGEFRAGLSSLFDSEMLDGSVVPYRKQLFAPGLTYATFVDPSGGRGDSFTLAIGHRRDGRVIVERLRAWRPPFNPSGVVAEVANLVKSYHLASMTGDRYGGEWVAEAFQANELDYRTCETPKSDLYLALLASVNSRTVDVPDMADLLRELRGLERRRGNSGRDRVDHAPGAHDDLANALAGVAHLLGEEPSELCFVGGDTIPQTVEEAQAEHDEDRRRRGEESAQEIERVCRTQGYWGFRD